MLMPEAPTVLTIWTLGVEVERCLCRDWPSPPGMGKWNAEAGDKRSILHNVKWNVKKTAPTALGNLERPSARSAMPLVMGLTQEALGLRLSCFATVNSLAWESAGTRLYRYWNRPWGGEGHDWRRWNIQQCVQVRNGRWRKRILLKCKEDLCVRMGDFPLGYLVKQQKTREETISNSLSLFLKKNSC